MAEYQSKKITGWRSRMDDAITEIRSRFWNAPSHTVYIDGIEAPRADDLIGHVRWFNRVFGPERAIASAELKQLQRVKQKILYAEKMAAQTSEQREKKRIKDHERYLLRRANQSMEDRRVIYAKARARRAAQTEADREHERAMSRQWRAKQGSEWRAAEVIKKKLRRLAKPELYKAIEKRTKARTRDASNARRRARYAAGKAAPPLALGTTRSRRWSRCSSNATAGAGHHQIDTHKGMATRSHR